VGGVLDGFIVVGGIVLVGYLLGRLHILPDTGRDVLARLAFFVASPALLFELLSDAELDEVFSPVLWVTVIATAVSALSFIAVGAIRHWGVAKTTLGSMCASYVNAGNLGLPLAAYVLGDARTMAPVMLFQLMVFAPVATTVIDLATERRTSVWQILATPLRNPIVVGAVLGVIAAAAQWKPAQPIADIIDALAGMAVPALLLAYGISLFGSVVPGRAEDGSLLAVSMVLKLVVQPLVAWLLGAFVFDLQGQDLLAVVFIAALPAAQNIFTYAVRFRVGEVLSRDAILVSTTAAPFLLMGVAAIFG
jgi:malonate transporter